MLVHSTSHELNNQTDLSKVGLVLLHNDLRIHDNATLLSTSRSCDYLLVVYVDGLAKELATKSRDLAYTQADCVSQHRQNFLQQTLHNLNEKLTKLGNRLIYLHTNHVDKNKLKLQETLSATQQLLTLIQDAKVTDIFVSQTADYDQNQAYLYFKECLKQLNVNIQWHSKTTHTLFDGLPEFVKVNNALPKVFTQFRKKIESKHHLLLANQDMLISPTPSTLPKLPNTLKNIENYFYRNYVHKLNNVNPIRQNQPIGFVGGEDFALNHLNDYFESDAPKRYKQTRNTLDVWQDSTKFSAWLANGSLSVRVLLDRLRQYEANKGANESTYWIFFELLWREYFYFYALEHGKKLFVFKGISNKKPLTTFYSERFEAWKNGNTPYAIVNACMNQLKATGYMSNRGRQLVASCFVHELGLDWRYGASYFEQQLIDYDVASNWGNWQYLAGVGADPRSGRQFNLEKQTNTYDPNHTFIDKWQGSSNIAQLDSIGADGYPTAYR